MTRLACLHLPGFALQVHARAAPHLLGTAFAVLEPDRPRVSVCSRQAILAGVRAGMTAAQARALAPEVRLVDAAPAAYDAAMRALGDALLSFSDTIDVATQGQACVLAPPRARAESWGEKLVHAASRQGLRTRVGIADDRFTAWAATQALPHALVRVVPSGGSARFLAPLGLELLPTLTLDVDVRHMMGLLGIRTLGDFAALPPPSVGRQPWSAAGAQALAAGQDRTPLVPFAPTEPIREEVALESSVTELGPLTFVLRPLYERAVARLAGRGRAAERTIVALRGPSGTTEITIDPPAPTRSSAALIDLARTRLAERSLAHPVSSMTVTIAQEGDAPAELELELWREDEASSAGGVEAAVAQLRTAFGPDAAYGVALADSPRPETSFKPVPFADGAKKKRPGKPRRAAPPPPRVPGASVSALRILHPPAAIEAETEPDHPPRAIRIDGARHRVVGAQGPLRLEGEWWTDEPLARDYFEVETDDGAHYWLFRDRGDGRFYLHGVFD